MVGDFHTRSTTTSISIGLKLGRGLLSMVSISSVTNSSEIGGGWTLMLW